MTKNKVVIKGIEFNRIEPTQRENFSKYLHDEIFPTIHQSFGYNYALDGVRTNVMLKTLEECLCIFKMYKNRITLSGAPLGINKNNYEDVINYCNEIIEKVNGKRPKIIGENFFVEDDLSCSFNNKFSLTQSILGNEYFYDCQKVYNMYGNKFESFRGNVKRFVKLYEVETFIENEESSELLNALYNEWANEWLNRSSSLSLIFDHDYYKKSVNEADIIGQKFITVFEKNRLIGMAGIIPINDKTCMCLNRKALIEYKGLSEYLIYKCCEYAVSKGYIYLNDSWDANHSGLRQFKNKCNPVNTIKLYQLMNN